MRVFNFIFIILSGVMFACNNNSGGKTANADTAQKANAADSGKKPAVDSAKMIMPLPPVPPGAKIHFVNLRNGETVGSPFEVIMGVKGLKVEAAGAVVPGSGHHHLLIDAGDSIAAGQVIPKDEHHLHFGNGQTKTMVTLPPGMHRLTLQFADGLHRSYGNKLAATIMIKVK